MSRLVPGLEADDPRLAAVRDTLRQSLLQPNRFTQAEAAQAFGRLADRLSNEDRDALLRATGRAPEWGGDAARQALADSSRHHGPLRRPGGRPRPGQVGSSAASWRTWEAVMEEPHTSLVGISITPPGLSGICSRRGAQARDADTHSRVVSQRLWIPVARELG